MTSYKKVPTLSGESNYAQFGSWKTDLSAYLSRNDMQLFSSLDESKIPDAFPAEVAEGDADFDAYVAEKKRFKSRFGIEDEYELLAVSEKAWAVLHEATRPAPDLNRVVNLHQADFKGAYLALEKKMRGNVKTAARNVRRELLSKIREISTCEQLMQVITIAERTNQDLEALGTGDELKEEDLYEEILDVLQRIPDLKHVYQLARLAESKIGDWSALHPYLVEVCGNMPKTKARGDGARGDRGTVLSADRGRGRGRGSRGGGRGNGRGGRGVPAGIVCWRCGGNHFSTSRTGAGCEVPCHCDICGKDDHATAHHDKYAEVKKKQEEKAKSRGEHGGRGRGRSASAATRPSSSEWLCLVLEKPYPEKTVHTVNFQKKEPCARSKSSQPPYEVVPVDFALDDDDDSLPDLASISDTSDTNSEADSLVSSEVGSLDDDDDSLPDLVSISDTSDTNSEADSLMSSEVGSLDYDSDDLPDLESYTEAGSLVNSKVGSLGYESDDSKLSFLSGDDVLNADLRLNARTGEWEFIDDEPAPGLGDQWEFVPRPELLSIDKKPPALDPHHLLLDSGAWVHCTGDLAAFDAESLVPVTGDELSATTAEGNDIKATKKGNVSVHVHGAGSYTGDNRVVTFTDVYYMPDLPTYRRVISAGYLESGEHEQTTGVVIEIDTKASSIHMFDSSTRKPIYSFAMAKDYTWYIPSASAVGDSKPCARPETTKTNRPRGYFAPITATQPRINSQLFHRRLMHAGPTALDNTAKNTLGVTLSDNPLKMPTPIDEPCLIGKGHKTAKDTGPFVPANLNLFDNEIDEVCIDFHGPYPKSKRGNIGFYNFVVSDTNAEVSIAVKSTSEFEIAYQQARMRMGKPKYLRLDNQQNLVSNSPTAMTEFEANRLKEGTRLRRAAPAACRSWTPRAKRAC